MVVYIKPTNGNPVPCPYINSEKFIQRYTVLKDLDSREFDFMIENGWRHFGYYFFSPACSDCSSCTPIRTRVNEFKPSKSQRKILRKGSDITVLIKPLEFREEYFDIYKKHSKIKFNQDSSIEEFKENFFSDALLGRSSVVTYELDSVLIGLGFIDLSEKGVSSVYFCYDTDYSRYSLGTLSALWELGYAKSIGKEYYYMGYYIEGNGSMEYKARFTPLDFLDWSDGLWKEFTQSRTVSLCSKDTLE